MTHPAWNTAAATDRSLAHTEQKSEPAAQFVNGAGMSETRLGRIELRSVSKVLGVLATVWFGSFEKVKCLCVLLITFGSLTSLNSPAASANLSAETPLIKPSRRHINLSEMIVVLAQISLHGDHHSKWRLAYVGRSNRYLLMWSGSKAGRAWRAKSVICGHRE